MSHFGVHEEGNKINIKVYIRFIIPDTNKTVEGLWDYIEQKINALLVKYWSEIAWKFHILSLEPIKTCIIMMQWLCKLKWKRCTCITHIWFFISLQGSTVLKIFPFK
jgi:hypothetical protein